MTRIAVFVEGITERKFIKKLIYRRYSAVAKVLVKELVLRGKDPFLQKIDANQAQGIDCLFLIIEAPEHSKLLSMIKANAENMINNVGYSFIIGLRDLTPNKRGEKIVVINGIDRFLSGLSVTNKISIVLAVMETEAWFLYDWQLFQRLHGNLSPDYIKGALNIDLINDDPELQYNDPSHIIDKVLRLVELRYRKHESEIDNIVGNIDFNFMFSCTNKIDSFLRFVSKLDCCGLLP